MSIFALIPLILKLSPLIFAALNGITLALSKLPTTTKVEIDEEKLAALIQELTEKQVSDIVEKHAGRIIAYVPSEEDKARQDKLDELEDILKKDQDEYNNRIR
jgi:ribosomal protein L12E/L44/L45/RPP1/RPP2